MNLVVSLDFPSDHLFKKSPISVAPTHHSPLPLLPSPTISKRHNNFCISPPQPTTTSTPYTLSPSIIYTLYPLTKFVTTVIVPPLQHPHFSPPFHPPNKQQYTDMEQTNYTPLHLQENLCLDKPSSTQLPSPDQLL